jgi:hypothetical protein
MMDLARARDIVIAINDRCMFTMDLPAKCETLAGVSLAEMIEAKRLVQNASAANKAAAAVTGEPYTLYCVPDDRLIAAVYTLEHYDVSRTAILAVPRKGWIKALAIVEGTAPGTEPADDDEMERADG